MALGEDTSLPLYLYKASLEQLRIASHIATENPVLPPSLRGGSKPLRCSGIHRNPQLLKDEDIVASQKLSLVRDFSNI